MELSTVVRIERAFLRLVGALSDDDALTEQGEVAGEVVDTFLTMGCRSAQRWMLQCGYKGWRKRTSALAFTGNEDTDGGRKVDLPADFLRAYGNRRRSALVEPNGTRWGQEIDADEDDVTGNYYYVRGDELWVPRLAQLPTTVYLDFHYMHPAWDNLADAAIDFPLEARMLIAAEAANLAKEDNWLPGGKEMEGKIARARALHRDQARDIARATKSARRLKRPKLHGTRW